MRSALITEEEEGGTWRPTIVDVANNNNNNEHLYSALQKNTALYNETKQYIQGKIQAIYTMTHNEKNQYSANSKRHQRLDEILIIFTCTIQEISKVICKKTLTETRVFTTSLCCMKRAHYSKRMLGKQDCVKFRGCIAWQSFFF